MKKSVLILIPFIVLWSLIPTAGAVQILYNLSDLEGGYFAYSYTITNDTIASGLYCFDIYFPSLYSADAFNYSDIAEIANPDPTNWSTTIFPPSSPNLGAIYDAYTSTTPISLNNSLSGFEVSFNYSWSDILVLGPQYFEIYDTEFNLLETGFTSAAPAPVPEPGTMILFASGILSLGLIRWAKKWSRTLLNFIFLLILAT